MFGARDVVWSVVLGVLGLLALQSYPILRAERYVERDATMAFQDAFAGRRMVDGTIIERPGGGGVRTETMASPIDFVTFRVLAEHATWNGSQIELVVHHVVGFDRTRDDSNLVHDVHIKVSKDGSRLRYDHFQVRGEPPVPQPILGNPWAPLMIASSGGKGPSPWDKNDVERPVAEPYE